MTKLIFSSHLYEWEGQIYLQTTGGPTGLRSVGPISRCLMDKWIELVLKISQETLELHRINPVMFSKLEIELIIKYDDDCFSALTTLTTGTRWNPATRSLQWDPETDRRDREEGTNMERITMEEVAKLSSVIWTDKWFKVHLGCPPR